MRNADRLDDVYAEIARLHKEYVPDWRVGQLWVNFLRWLETEKHRDLFFPEEDELMEHYVEFIDTMSPYKKM